MVRRIGENRPRTSLGSTLTGILVGCAILGGFIATAVVIRPTILQARIGEHSRGVPPGGVEMLDADRRQVLDAIVALIGASDKVLAVHSSPPHPLTSTAPFVSPRTAIVLRIGAGSRDEGGERVNDAFTHWDFIRSDEIAIISHSRILQVVTLHLHTAEERTTHRRRAEVVSPEFVERWCTDPSVTSRIIATGVSDLRASFPAAQSGLRLELTWPSESADGEGEVTVDVEIRHHRSQRQ